MNICLLVEKGAHKNPACHISSMKGVDLPEKGGENAEVFSDSSFFFEAMFWLFFLERTHTVSSVYFFSYVIIYRYIQCVACAKLHNLCVVACSGIFVHRTHVV